MTDLNDKPEKLKQANKAFDKWHRLRRHIDREGARLAWDAGRAFEWMAAAPAAQEAPSGLEFDTGLRLRLVCELLGLGKAVPEDPAELYAVAFSALGMVRHEIENLQRAAPLTQAADQRTAGAPVAKSDDDRVKIAAQRVRIMELEDQVARVSGDFEELQSASAVAELSATPAAPLAQQSVPIGYVANTAHGWQFRTAAPDENSQWAGMWRAVAYISAQQSEPVAIIRKKFSDLPLGICFRYIGGSEKWVVLEHHGCGLVAGYQPHDGWVAGQSICSFADTEQECRETEVEVVLSAPLPAQQASERDAALDWSKVSAASQQANQGFGQWMPERWIQLFVAAYNDAAMGDAWKGEPS